MVYSLTCFRSLPKYCLLTETILALLFKFAHIYCTVFLHPPFTLFIVISIVYLIILGKLHERKNIQ